MSFENLNLQSDLLKAINKCGFTKPTPIQQEAIPVILKGKDLLASAQTGTGKTAAFVLPILQNLLSTKPKASHGPRVLILTPTRELAQQVTDNITQLSHFCRVKSGSIVGGVPYGPQIKMLRNTLDILVATPGRLMDHMGDKRVDFSRVEMIVLDEADRMLDMGFVDDVRKICAQLPKKRQTLFFSATLEGKVLSVARELLQDPVRVQQAVNRDQHKAIQQYIFRADDVNHKHRILAHHLDDGAIKQVVIFTSTKRGADKMAKSLSVSGHASAALHGDMPQNKRKRTVDRMRRGNLRVLVATDVAARGLDIKGISHVINFDLPMVAEDYIHRIGRTGRGGAKGTAISLVGPDDWRKLVGIERLTGNSLEQSVIPGMEPKSPEPRQTRKPGRRASPGKRPVSPRAKISYKGNRNKSGRGRVSGTQH